MPIKSEITELLADYEQKRISNDDYTNHWVRRFFRCWLDGSYKGYEHYKNNILKIEEYNSSDKSMRMFVIDEFSQFMALEHNCSRDHAQRSIVSSGIDLEELNKELIEDARDMLED